MKRKRLTQVFPFLLPIRKWQRKKLFYLEMLIDGNKYAKNKSEALLPKTYQIAPVYRSERDKKTCRGKSISNSFCLSYRKRQNDW